jgi:hypothetical protein
VGPSFVDLVVLKGNLRPSSHLHRILDATRTPGQRRSASDLGQTVRECPLMFSAQRGNLALDT